MTTRQTQGLASASAASAAGPAAATSTQSSTTPAQQPSLGTGTPRPLKLDAPGAAKPAGYNPSFSPDGQHFVQQGGAQLYQAIYRACHMPDAAGTGCPRRGFLPGAGQQPPLGI